VATKFHYEQSYDADPSTVWAMLSDPAFITDDGGCTLTSTRVLPANLPAVAKPFVGDTLTVKETQVWTAPAPDGSRTATTSVEFSAPMSFIADMTLTPSGTGSVVTTHGDFTASVPFVGGKIEGVAVHETTRYLEKEQLVGREWLAGR
jgi:hypothetical protein